MAEYPVVSDKTPTENIYKRILKVVAGVRQLVRTDPSLTLNAHKIYEISGPVSYVVLNPTTFELPDGSSFNMPILLIFGDVHAGLERQCYACPKLGCVNVYDESFIGLLNELGRKYNVDMYIERHSDVMYQRSADLTAGITRSRAELYADLLREPRQILDLFVNYAYPCFFHEYKGRPFYDQGCPARHIKWHLADARQFNYNLLKNASRRIKRWFETILFFFIQNLVTLRIYNVSWALVDFCDANMIEYDDLLQDMETILVAMCNREWNVLRDYMFGKYANVSIIVHQLRGSPFKEMWEREWLELYYQQIYFDDAVLGPLKPIIHDYMSFLSNPDDNWPPLEDMLLYEDHLYDFGVPLMDIYTLARIMKRSTDLRVLYVGDSHVRYMSAFLVRAGLCSVVSQYMPVDIGRRCIHFTNTINVNDLIENRRDLVKSIGQ